MPSPVSRPLGTSRSTVRRNFRNSWRRCRGRHCPITMPVNTFNAANKGGGAVAFVVVGHRLPATLGHRQRRLRAVKRLHRGLFVGAQHDRVLRRVQIQTHDIDELLLELGVARHLERVDSVRFETQLLPYPLHSALRHPGNPGHRPCAPMRLALRPVFLGECHDLLDRGVGDRGLAAPTLADLPELDQTVLAATPWPAPLPDEAQTANGPTTPTPHAGHRSPTLRARVCSHPKSYPPLPII